MFDNTTPIETLLPELGLAHGEAVFGLVGNTAATEKMHEIAGVPMPPEPTLEDIFPEVPEYPVYCEACEGAFPMREFYVDTDGDEIHNPGPGIPAHLNMTPEALEALNAEAEAIRARVAARQPEAPAIELDPFDLPDSDQGILTCGECGGAVAHGGQICAPCARNAREQDEIFRAALRAETLHAETTRDVSPDFLILDDTDNTLF